MNELHLDELKKTAFGILTYIDRVCKENNIRYFLCGGTLLGAIRHNGFIPWDDDIDIAMPRPDYDRFLDLCRQPDDRYIVLSPTNEGYYCNYAKVVDSRTKLIEKNCKSIDSMGVFVDVFPLDGMPSDAIDREKHFTKLVKLKRRINSFNLLKPKLRKNLIAYAKAMHVYVKNKKADLSFFQREYETLAKKYSYNESEYVFMSGGIYGTRDIFLKSLFDCSTLKTFEGREFSIMENYDLYLTQLYGNYMQPPPVEKQVTHHHFTATYRSNGEHI